MCALGKTLQIKYRATFCFLNFFLKWENWIERDAKQLRVQCWHSMTVTTQFHPVSHAPQIVQADFFRNSLKTVSVITHRQFSKSEDHWDLLTTIKKAGLAVQAIATCPGGQKPWVKWNQKTFWKKYITMRKREVGRGDSQAGRRRERKKIKAQNWNKKRREDLKSRHNKDTWIELNFYKLYFLTMFSQQHTESGLLLPSLRIFESSQANHHLRFPGKVTRTDLVTFWEQTRTSRKCQRICSKAIHLKESSHIYVRMLCRKCWSGWVRHSTVGCLNLTWFWTI